MHAHTRTRKSITLEPRIYDDTTRQTFVHIYDDPRSERRTCRPCTVTPFLPLDRVTARYGDMENLALSGLRGIFCS